jgi:uncharacterized membrane protein YfcA
MSNNFNMPQIKSVLINCLVILIGAPLGSLALTWMNGELNGWADIPRYLDHAMFIGFMMTVAWLGMRSPLAARAQTLISSLHTDAQGASTKTEAEIDSLSGATIKATDKGIVVKQEPAKPEPADPKP